MDWEYEFKSYFVLRTLRSCMLLTYNTSSLSEKNSIITIENCSLQLTPFRRTTFKNYYYERASAASGASSFVFKGKI